MSNTIERDVTINADYFGPGNGVYVIKEGQGSSCLGFDVCLERIERYATELVGRHALPEKYLDEPPKPPRGSMEAYDTMRNLMDQLKKVCDETGERAVADLTPQLVGLDGWRVEVEDMHGEVRRFIVGRSTGWLPIHLEVSRRNSSGGMGADREYRRVTKLEWVG